MASWPSGLREECWSPMAAATDPVYLRVLEDLRERIRGGLLPPGARVPSRNAIIAKYGVGETAAKHALQGLATEGLIEARTGSGSYVRKVPAACYLEHDRLQFPGSPFGLDEAAQDQTGDGASTGRTPAGPAATPAGVPGSARPLSRGHQTSPPLPPPPSPPRAGPGARTGWGVRPRDLLA